MDNAILRLALDLNLFDILVESQGAPVNTATLAKEIGVDTILLQRILCALNAMGAVEQVGTNSFKSNKTSIAFATQKAVCGAEFSYVNGSLTLFPSGDVLPVERKIGRGSPEVVIRNSD